MPVYDELDDADYVLSPNECDRITRTLIKKVIAETDLETVEDVDAVAKKLLEMDSIQEAKRSQRSVSIENFPGDYPTTETLPQRVWRQITPSNSISGVIDLLNEVARDAGFKRLRVYLYDDYQKKLFSIGAAGSPAAVHSKLRHGLIEKQRLGSETNSHSFVCVDRNEITIVHSDAETDAEEFSESLGPDGVLEVRGAEECLFLKIDNGRKRIHGDIPFHNQYGKVSVDFGDDEVPNDFGQRLKSFEPFVKKAGEKLAFLYYRKIQEPFLRAARLISGCHSYHEIAAAVTTPETCAVLGCHELQFFEVAEDDHGALFLSRLARTGCSDSAPVSVTPADPVFEAASRSTAVAWNFTSDGFGEIKNPESVDYDLTRISEEVGGPGTAVISPICDGERVRGVLVAYLKGENPIRSHSDLSVTIRRLCTECLPEELSRVSREHISLGYPSVWQRVSRFSVYDRIAFCRFLTELTGVMDQLPGIDRLHSVIFGRRNRDAKIEYYRIAGAHRDAFVHAHVVVPAKSLTGWLMRQEKDFVFSGRLQNLERFEECTEVDAEQTGLLAARIRLECPEGKTTEFGQLILLGDPNQFLVCEQSRLLRFLADRIAEALARRELNARYMEGLREDMWQFTKRLNRSVKQIARDIYAIAEPEHGQYETRQLVSKVNEVLGSSLFSDAAKFELLCLDETSRIMSTELLEDRDQFRLFDLVSEAAASSKSGVKIQNRIDPQLTITAPKKRLSLLLFRLLSDLNTSRKTAIEAAYCLESEDDGRVELLISGLQDFDRDFVLEEILTRHPVESVGPDSPTMEEIKKLACDAVSNISESVHLQDGRKVVIRSEATDTGTKLVISIPVYSMSKA